MTMVSRSIAAALLAASLGLGACGGAGERGTTRGGSAGSRHALRMRMTAMDGGEIDLLRYRGRVVVLHLFDTDSAAAQLDAEQLTALARREQKRVKVIGICLDAEGYPMAAAWRRALGVGYLIALGDRDLVVGHSPLGKLHVVPTTVLLDRNGYVVHRIERQLRPGELAEMVDDLF